MTISTPKNQSTRNIKVGRSSSENDLNDLLLHAIDIMGAEYGTILLIDVETEKIEIVAFKSIKETDGLIRKEYALQDGIGGWIARKKKAYVSPDVSQDVNYLQCIADLIKSEIGFPILLKNDLLGVIVFDSTKKQKFSNKHLNKFKSLSTVVANTLNKYKTDRISDKKDDENKEIAFVIMPFKDPFDNYYSTLIRPVIKSSGLRPLRVDEIPGPTQIISDIWTSINKSKFIIAELTTKNPNVMYELGLCHAINKPVIMLSQTLDDVPFDLKSYRCIIYNTIDPGWGGKLRNNLKRHILAILQGQYGGPFENK